MKKEAKKVVRKYTSKVICGALGDLAESGITTVISGATNWYARKVVKMVYFK